MQRELLLFCLLVSFLAVFHFDLLSQLKEGTSMEPADAEKEPAQVSINQTTTMEKQSETKKLPAETGPESNVHIEEKPGWELVWHDEFEQAYLSDDNWNIENWAAEKNNELQYYLPENVSIQDGMLRLTSRKETYQGREYTSGAVHSHGKFDFQYGKAEIRAKLPEGKGIFPAFWMMSSKDNHWLPEIDILEMLGDKPNEIWMVSHWLGEEGQLVSDSASYIAEQSFAEDFHTYSVEWTPTQITWLIDDQIRFQSSKHVPHEKMYLYLNTAIGGNWPGNPTEKTIFPQTFDIDYVRVYKQKQGGE